MSESGGWHARRTLDVGERFARWGCWRQGAVEPRGRPHVVCIQLPPGLAAEAAEDTYLCYLRVHPCANGRRVWTERDERASDSMHHEPSVAECPSHSRCATSRSRSHTAAAAREKRSAASQIGECPVVEVTVDVERQGDTKEPRRRLTWLPSRS